VPAQYLIIRCDVASPYRSISPLKPVGQFRGDARLDTRAMVEAMPGAVVQISQSVFTAEWAGYETREKIRGRKQDGC